MRNLGQSLLPDAGTSRGGANVCCRAAGVSGLPSRPHGTWQGKQVRHKVRGVHTEFHGEASSCWRFSLQSCTSAKAPARSVICFLRETPCALGETLCRTYLLCRAGTGGPVSNYSRTMPVTS